MYRLPINLRPQVFNLHVPASFYPNSQTAWRYMNRTLYRGSDCTAEERFWLRNPKNESDLQHEMRVKYNHITYHEDLFYKTHKISMQNFIEKLEESSEPQSLIDKLFLDPSHGTGRRGVLSVKKSVQIVDKKMRSKDKLRQFAKKFTGTAEGLSSSEIRSSGFMRSDMLY